MCLSLQNLPRRRTCWHLFPFLRNRVVSKLARQWMAAQQPFQSKPNSASHAKAFNRLICIARTRRLKTATPREQNGQVGFVEPQRKQRAADKNGSFFASNRCDLWLGGACPVRWCGANR